MKVLGHPLHMMLVHFPSALLPMDFACSLLARYTGNSSFTDAAFYALFGAVVAGALAVITGAFDLLSVAENVPLAIRKALIHGVINSTVIAAYSIPAFLAYQQFPDLVPNSTGLLILKGGLLTFMMAGNYLGGSLILKDRVAVENKRTERS